MPLTWDQSSPVPTQPGVPAEGTERTPTFEPADFGEGEQTVVTGTGFDLKAHYTGRSGAIAKLEKTIDKAFAERDVAFVLVTGEPGMGKSRIISELGVRVRTEHPTALVMTGIADENAPAYGPVSRALTVRFGLAPGEDPAESRDKIQAGVAEVVQAQRVTEVSHLIAHLLRVPFDDSPVVTPLLESPQRLEARLFMALKRLFAAEAERHPVLFVVENLELCGTDTINFLQYLAAGLAGQRVAIVGTATPQLAERHPAFGEGDVAPVHIDLAPLTPDESEQLFRALCKPLATIPQPLIVHVRMLGGSPRAIHELVRLLLESQVFVRTDETPTSAWRIDNVNLTALRLPKNYEAIVAARLRVMDATERRVLEMAAAVGETSWLDAILSLERHLASHKATPDPDGPTLSEIASSGDHSRITLVAALAKLIDGEWLADVGQSSIAGERELRFTSPTLWSVVYKGIDEPRRRGFHATIAHWLELHPEGRNPSAQEEVARHLALAGEAREAASRYRRAAEAARAQFANERAIQLFDRALMCIGDTDIAARIHLWHDLGSVYELIGDFEAALGAFERMLRLSWVAASKTKAAVAFNKMGRVWRRKGDLKLALEYLGRGLELFRAAGDQRGIAGSLDDIGKSMLMLGRYDEAHAKITEALARRGKHGDKRAIATSLSRLGDVQQERGHYEAALKCHQDALELRREAGDRWGMVVSQNHLAALAFELGDYAAARAGWLAALPDAEAIGALPLCALVLTNLGEVAIVENKLEEARSRLENALEIIDDIEDRGLETECCRHLSLLEKLQGQHQAAKELAERALAVAQKAGLREKEAQAYLALGDVLASSLATFGDSDDDEPTVSPAAAAFGKAVEVLRSIDNQAALAHALFAFGRYQAEVGKVAAGRDMLRDALLAFEKLGLSKPAAEVSKLIASLE